jgi:hypothetical protein
MTRTSDERAVGIQRADAWVVDYGAARAQAIKWLGDRYLLAKPINRIKETSPIERPAAAASHSDR